jgi:hypothetical protein
VVDEEEEDRWLCQMADHLEAQATNNNTTNMDLDEFFTPWEL